MSKSNPYREWLGINVARPNYFELLGLSVDQTDVAIIKQAAEVTLKRLSERSANVSADNAQQQIKQQLAQQIRQAYSVLRDPQARTAYLEKLKTSDSVPTKQSAPAKTPNPSQRLPEIKTQLESSVVISTETQVSDSSAIRVSSRPKRRRASGSRWGIWALIVVLFVVGPMILIGILFATGRWRMPGLTSPVAQQTDTQPLTGPDSVDDIQNTNADSEKVPKPTQPIGDSNQPNSNNDQTPSAQQIVSGPSPNDPDSTNEQAKKAEVNEESSEQKSFTDSELPPEVATPSLGVSPDETKEADELSATQREALHQITRALAVLKTSLRYHDYDNAARACNRLAVRDEAFDGGALGPITANDGRGWVSSVRDFWTTVELQCQKIPAGKEFQFRDELCPIIECQGNRVVVRFKGTPEAYLLSELPAETLIELAESQGIPDIPSWRLQKATYLLLFADLSLSAENDVREFIELSASDGHDVEPWLRLADLRLWLMTTEFDIVQGAPQLDNSQVTVEILQQLGVDDVRQINAELALGLNQQLIDMALQSSEREERTKQLLVAWQLALTAGDLSRVDQTLSLLATDYALDRLGALVESFQAIMTQPLAAEQQENSIYRLLSIAEQLKLEDRTSPRLSAALNLARDLASKLDRPSLRNRIERLLR